MSSIIKQAIERRTKLRLYHDGKSFIAEPYAFGIDVNGVPLLLCFQTDGLDMHEKRDSWRVIALADLMSIEPVNVACGQVRADYVRNHPAFHTVLVQV
ncbi:hypothetical protein [Noviherbaspirillum aerium]|uniref:hypothetical protein n=1 Tax=Noviherbaspirillum aerium TaxID=2588497 RepID=UPI00124E745E|nr:hypothetical protein [Noviherbaspirillum aerium]